MKHSIAKRMYAVILAVVMFATNLFFSSSFTTYAGEDTTNSVSTVGINNPEKLYDLANWNAISGDKSHVSVDGEALILEPLSLASSKITLSEETLSYYGENLIKISYRFYKEEGNKNNGGSIPIIYDYRDENNYKYLNIIYTTRWVAQRYTVTDGQEEITSTTVMGTAVDFTQWIDVDLDYSVDGKVNICFRDEDGGEKELSINVANSAQLILASVKRTYKITYQEIELVGINEEDKRIQAKIIDRFRKNYQEILSLTDNMVVVNYKDVVNSAITEYETMSSEYAQEMLEDEYQKLLEVKDKISQMETQGIGKIPERASDDYSTITESFENGLTKWSNFAEGKSAPEIVQDESGNHMLKLTSASIVGLNSFSYPDDAFVKKLSYRVKHEGTVGNIWCSLLIPLGYVDADNHIRLDIYRSNANDEKLSYRTDSMSQGISNASSPSSRKLTNDYDGEWLNVTIEYSRDGKAIVSIENDGATSGDVIRVNSLLQGKVSLLGAALRKGENTTVYYDDVEIEFEKGDFVQDIESDEVVVYYSGNTGVQGDDAVTLTGENLYDTLMRAYIVKLSDDATADAGYVKQVNFDTMGTDSVYLQATEAEKVWEEAIKESEPERLKLLQLDDTQVKFIIPEAMGKGIFAVKLEGFNEHSDEEDAVILLNTPKISFFQGTDATICNPGGTLRLVGENLALYDIRKDEKDYIEDKYDVMDEYLNNQVRVLLQTDNYRTILSGEAVSVKAEQYINVTLPLNLPEGEYEIMIYNGFGNGACWSMPCDTKLTVGESPYESWPKTVFNIRDFGATGDKSQNATGCLIDALTAAAENDGGIIYLPKGVYTLIHSIIIPENVQIIGDGKDNSILLWTPDQWIIGDIPPYLCGISSNVVMKDLSFSGTRCMNILYLHNGKDIAKNVYIENVDISFDHYAGNPTGGTMNGVSLPGFSGTDLQTLIKKECGSGSWLYVNNGYNVQISNLYAYATVGMGMTGDAVYVHASDMENDTGWQNAYINNATYEYCEFIDLTFGLFGDRLLMYGCEIADAEGNNRELAVADGGPTNRGGKDDVRLKKDESDPSGCTYLIQNIQLGRNSHVGFQLYIKTGQGDGQLRTIVANDKDKVVLNSPFAVEPNQNGLAAIMTGRVDQFFVNMRYHNGMATGYYSRAANVIYNHCIYSKVSNIYFNAQFGNVVWYTTCANGHYYDSYIRHNYGTGENDRTGFSFLSLLCHDGVNGIAGFCWRNNVFDGYTFHLESSVTRGVVGVTLDKNDFIGVDYAISKHATGGYTDGVLLYKNRTDDVKGLNKMTNAGSYTSVFGYPSYWEYESEEWSNSLVIGDVNGDGIISLRDCTTIKLYLAGQISLDEKALLRADFFADESVTLRDASAIMHYITTGEVLVKEDEYFDGNF